jgi:fructose-1-phosphate kinase PfkB-like protein
MRRQNPQMLIAGPNLTFDRTGRINVLSPGAVLRFTEVVVPPGGNGLNVARTARALDAPATLVAFVPGFTGRAAAEMISQEGVTLVGVPSAGEISIHERHPRTRRSRHGPQRTRPAHRRSCVGCARAHG